MYYSARNNQTAVLLPRLCLESGRLASLQQNLSGSELILIVSHVDSISMWATVVS